MRNRDAVFNNHVVVSSAMPKENELDIDVLLSEFAFKNSKSEPSLYPDLDAEKETLGKTKIEEKINERFYNVDLSYRYCHILENIAQITTMYEADYLWERERDGLKYSALTSPNQHVKKFLEGVGKSKHLKDKKESISNLFEDKYSIQMMYFFKSTRRLLLFCDYWKNHIIKNNYSYQEEKKVRFANNMRHYANLAEFNVKKMIETINDDSIRKYTKIEPNKTLARLSYLQSFFTKIKTKFDAENPLVVSKDG